MAPGVHVGLQSGGAAVRGLPDLVGAPKSTPTTSVPWGAADYRQVQPEDVAIGSGARHLGRGYRWLAPAIGWESVANCTG